MSAQVFHAHRRAAGPAVLAGNLLCWALLGGGCGPSGPGGSEPGTPKNQPPPPGAAPAAPAGGTGTLRGLAVFSGKETPTPELLPNKVDANYCGAEIELRTVHVDPQTKGLKNVVITVEGVQGGKASAEAEVLTIANKGCAFVPRVSAIMAKTKVSITNADPVNHNTHPYLDGGSLFNVALSPGKDTRPRPLRHKGLVRLKCDVHSWMLGWIVVHDSPYFAVTDVTGKYSIPDVPAGTYTVKAWHESLGEQTARVTIGADGTVDQEFRFEESGG